MISHDLSLIHWNFHIFLQANSHLLQTQHSVSVEVQCLEGSDQLILALALVDEVNDEDKYTVLDVG